MNHIITTTFQSLRYLLTMMLVLGICFTGFVTGLSRIIFPEKHLGSMIVSNGEIKGSRLLAQKFDSPTYFSSRPSAVDYGTVASGASNKGPTSKDLARVVEERRAQWNSFGNPPADLLTASASGLDPDLSPEAVRFQVARVAEARNFDEEQVGQLKKLVEESIVGPTWGIFGMPRINILELNLALDQLAKARDAN